MNLIKDLIISIFKSKSSRNESKNIESVLSLLDATEQSNELFRNSRFKFLLEFSLGTIISSFSFMTNIVVTQHCNWSFVQYLMFNSMTLSTMFVFSIPAFCGSIYVFISYGMVVFMLGIRGPTVVTPKAFYQAGFSDLSAFWLLVIDYVICTMVIGIVYRGLVRAKSSQLNTVS
ncbi:Hypothetical predicted protein [Cloeon dipterum]|uniref:Uncharacterized protein n=1 Tax=Cloeon dipterum TaxID=197152 RepID=A0A8S1DYM2_9INSE|nr:Hypothetical predicted protein [Cloeon dipterum]